MVGGSDRFDEFDPEFQSVLEAVGAGRCRECGRRGYLDSAGVCSPECGRRLLAAYAREGHTHDPGEPPTNTDGWIDWESCPVCGGGG